MNKTVDEPSRVPGDRRRRGAASILAGSAGAAPGLAAEGKEKLAIDGGTPVRKTALRSGPYGPQFYDDVEKQELLEVLESKSPFRWWGGKSKVLQFEKAYAEHIGVKYALGVTSGTTALYTAMAALEIGPGDEVILPAWTWYADYDAVVLSRRPAGLRRDRRVVRHRSQATSRRRSRRGPRRSSPCHLQGGVADMDADPGDRPQAQAPRAWKTAPSAAADATRGSTSARSATSASTASSSARPSPRAKAAP